MVGRTWIDKKYRWTVDFDGERAIVSGTRPRPLFQCQEYAIYIPDEDGFEKEAFAV